MSYLARKLSALVLMKQTKHGRNGLINLQERNLNHMTCFERVILVYLGTEQFHYFKRFVVSLVLTAKLLNSFFK